MTRKHFVALAEALEEAHPAHNLPKDYVDACCTWDLVVARVSEVCARYNDNFDAERFLKACTPEGI